MERVLEPELMDDPQQVVAYARANFEKENQEFVDQFLRLYPEMETPHILDLGCGPGDIPIRVARHHMSCTITGVDASAPMLAHAEQAAREAGVHDRVHFLLKRFQEINLPRPVDVIISNSLVHHVPNPLQFWYSVKTLLKPGGLVFVADLLRPESPEAAQAIVDEHAADESERLRHDFFHSLCAALTEDEVASHLARLNLSGLMVDMLDDRHWIVYGRV